MLDHHDPAPRRPLRFLALAAGFALAVPAARGQATSTEAQKLFPAAGSSFQTFGRACLVEGDVLLVTANGADNKGAAYCYRRIGGVWTPSQKFSGSDSLPGDFFGFAAALDGTEAVIGASQEDTLGTNAGAAYVFHDDGSTWTQVQKLLAPDGAAFDHFGSAVALHGDLIVVGASSDGDAGASSGAAYVYRRSGPSWVFEQKLTASTADVEDQFGFAVATDGVRVIVSAVQDEEPGQGAPGAVFVFEHDGGGWHETQRFVPADAADGDWFGWALALDGGVLAATAQNHDLPVDNGGAVYVYGEVGGTWTQQDKLVPSDLTADDSLGFSVALQGERLVAGAPGTGDTLSGALYEWHFDGTRWVEVHRWLTSDESAAVFPPAQLGMSCGIDGQTVFAGAPFGDGAVVNSGAAYRFVAYDLGLDAVPDSVPPAGPFALKTYGGLAGAPMALVVISVSGVPLGNVIWLGSFDAQGHSTLSLHAPPSISGLQATLLAAGYWAPGFKALSNSVSVDFQ